MIAIDSSSMIAFLSGNKGEDVEAAGVALEQKQAVFPPVVLSELLSDPKLPFKVISLFKEIPLLSVTDSFWERAGFLRAKILAKGYKAHLADVLISQSCIDHGVALITRDLDFKAINRLSPLKLI